MKKFLRNSGMVIRLAGNDFKSAYAGSVLGSLWAIAEPLVTVAVYWFVYTVAFGGGDVGGVPYYIWLSVGIAPWFFVSNGIRTVTASFRDYSYLVKKMCFNTAVIPAVRTFSALFSHMIFLAAVLIICVIEGILPNLVYVAISVLMAVIFVYSSGRFLAILCGLFKDVLNIITVVLNIGFWLTPVFWQADALPGAVARFIYLNPAAVIVESYRNAVLAGSSINISLYVFFAGLCIVLYAAGGLLQDKILPDISDRL